MLILEDKVITKNGVPIIECYQANAKNLPLVLLNHGTTGSAKDMLTMAYMLAGCGHFCVCIDAVWHGKRGDGKLGERLLPGVYKKNYLILLLQMAEDMSLVIDHYQHDERVNGKKIGMTGTSQGGYVTFMTMTKDNRITAAAPLIGSPDLEDNYGYSPDWDTIDQESRTEVIKHSPLRNFDKIFPTALLVQSGEDDTVVPVGGTRKLDEKLKPLYSYCPDNYKYIEYPGVKHAVTKDMREAAVDWLIEKLK